MALNLYSIAPDAPFLAVLAGEVLKGFPLPPGGPAIPLHRWSILVPNRRTAKALREEFLKQAGGEALLLPRIRPIGDLDDDFFDADGGPLELSDALSPVARHFSLIGLVRQWMREYPSLPLAQTLSHSPAQIQALAKSLAGLIDSLEIEEQPLSALANAFEIDIAEHQQAIVTLVATLHRELPALQMQENLISANERRSRLIRLNAEVLQRATVADPVIAAGSTGSIPATRALLKTIAGLPHGAVVLPGLDTSLSDECWKAVAPQHPQFALKQMLAEFEMPRHQVQTLGPAPGPRGWLASEMMRPSETTHEWARILPKSKPQAVAALTGMELLACRDTREEARVIATLIRLSLEEPGRSIALVSPDRVLARRVAAAVSRWDIVAEDSAGTPLIAHGASNFVGLLIDLVLEPLSTERLAAVLQHEAAVFGSSAEAARRLAADIDITLLRSPLMMMGLLQLPQLIDTLPRALGEGMRQHPAAAAIASPRFEAMARHALNVHQLLSPLLAAEPASLAAHIDRLLGTAQAVTDSRLWEDRAANELVELCQSLIAESHRLPDMPMAEAAALLRQYLTETKHLRRTRTNARIAIIGLLEARLLSFDTVILGGLSESVWPGAADQGPWLNRQMRDLLKVKQPEASIGQMAHDLVQSIGARHLILTWAKQDAGQPLTPSRWVLRLQTVLSACGVQPPTEMAERWRATTRHLDAAPGLLQITVPQPRPPRESRPRRLSVTQIDRLIADPYAIYASEVLKLTPLDELASEESYSLLGQVFHLALARFFKTYPERPPQDMLAALLDAGRQAFALLPDAPLVRSSWWPRYRNVAHWLAGEAGKIYAPHATLFAEASIASRFVEANVDLRGRADLVRIADGGATAIFDFKTGTVPTLTEDSGGFSHQLIIEAGMLERDGLGAREVSSVDKLAYVKVSGGIPAGKFTDLDLAKLGAAEDHLAGAVQLIAAYADGDSAFLPRANAGAQYKGYYDHLSRHAEWLDRGGSS